MREQNARKPRNGSRGNRRVNRQERTAARLYATQALFQMEAGEDPVGKVIEEFETWRIGQEIDGKPVSEADRKLFRTLVKGAIKHQAVIDRLTDKALKETWPLGRIDPTLRAIFRAAGAELIEADTPARVVIAEYVEIARDFFPEGREPAMVNAVLDRMAHTLRPGEFNQSETPRRAGDLVEDDATAKAPPGASDEAASPQTAANERSGNDLE